MKFLAGAIAVAYRIADALMMRNVASPRVANKRREDNERSLAATLKGCEAALRHRDMYYSGELCAELQCAFEKISRLARRPSAAVHDGVPFPQDGMAGFSRVIVLDAKRAVSPAGIFDFDVFIEVIAREFAEALGFDLDTRNLHREQLSQFLKDERDILFCFFALDHLTEKHYRQLRGLGFTQTDHRILFCGQSEFLRRQSTSFAESPGSESVFSSARIVQSDSETDPEQSSPELNQSAHLRVLTGAGARPVYPVHVQGLSIGRTECDVVIGDDSRISRRHARVERGFAGWQFQDMGSRNGFYVNGRGFGRGQRAPLPDGSVIRIGDSVMVFRADPPPTDPRIDSPVFPGVSPEAADVRQRIDELADSFGHVLILGEAGTGKKIVAKAIGARRAPHPFVTLDCTQLKREMVRSELFGHVRGAFTSAVSTRPGLVSLAGEGALFLDEIGDLPVDVQGELLRFLQDGSYRVLGSTDLRKSSARVVAATTIDLDRAVHQAQFRRDLLAQLRATNTPLTLPPLRERREDILGWTQRFFRLRGRDPGERPWTAGALECLLLYPWQENLRELLAAVNFAADQTFDFPCRRAHLPPQVRAHRSGLRMPADSRPDDWSPAPRLPPAAAPPPPPPPEDEDLLPHPDPTRAEMIEMLKHTRGRMRTTAQLLKIDRRLLYRLCAAYDINPNDYRIDRALDEDVVRPGD